MLNDAEGLLVVPPGGGVGQPLVLDLAKIVRGQVRIQEIARVTPSTAQELMAFFLGCWQDLYDSHTRVVEQRDKGKDALERAKAEALLGADEVIKVKGSKPSADLREAVVVLDVAVKAAQDRLHEIEAVLGWVKGRTQQFEAAWRSVRTLIEATRTPPPRLHGDGPAPAAYGRDQFDATSAFKDNEPPAGKNPEDELPPGLVGKVNFNRY